MLRNWNHDRDSYERFLFALFSPESVIQRFEQRAHAVDSRGVAEYLRALVATNAISEYLPDEQSGKPSSLPSLVCILLKF